LNEATSSFRWNLKILVGQLDLLESELVHNQPSPTPIKSSCSVEHKL